MRVESRHGRGRDAVAARVRNVVAGEAVQPRTSPLAGLLGRFSAGWAAQRVDPGRRGTVAMAAAVVVAALVTGAWVLAARPHAEPVQAVRTSVQSAHPAMQSGARASPAGSRPDSAALSSGAVLVVDVAGKVRRPGIYQLPSGARVDDALRAAGGVLPGVDSTMVNLAAKISDGEQIVVGVGGAVAGGAASAGTAAGGPLELNSASVEQLQSLPGVGPVLAQHIVDWRSAHGRFASVDQLREVSGIGPAKLAAIRALVAV